MTNEPYLLVVVVLREGDRVGLEEGIWMGFTPNSSWVFSYTYNLHIYYLNMINSNTIQVTINLPSNLNPHFSAFLKVTCGF